MSCKPERHRKVEMAFYACSNGNLNAGNAAVTELPDVTITSGREYSWSTISHWYSRQALFPSAPNRLKDRHEKAAYF
ncbi:hypothetical protein [Desulfobotulus alkaliphilus]|uniref:hypothetical protein n=1 Tax=Desulfobotulus alkaliphilus TaxID=622671 RepID=UPI001C9760C8|nr:hypothetical protein [Desulfobotulus alkaliphilus]